MKTMDPITPKEDYIEPALGTNGRWSYGFGDLEVGDQMRCPRPEEEPHSRSGQRVMSAAICWKKKNKATERAHIRFRSMVRTKYVLLERVA
jgi:hypothetical protein